MAIICEPKGPVLVLIFGECGCGRYTTCMGWVKMEGKINEYEGGIENKEDFELSSEITSQRRSGSSI